MSIKANGEFALQALNTDGIVARFILRHFVDLNNDSLVGYFFYHI